MSTEIYIPPHETVDRARKTLREMSLIPSYGESACRLLGGLADNLDKAAFQMQVDDELGNPRERQIPSSVEEKVAKLHRKWVHDPKNNGDYCLALLANETPLFFLDIERICHACVSEKTASLKTVLIKCFRYLSQDIEQLTLNESARRGTQALSKEIAEKLDSP